MKRKFSGEDLQELSREELFELAQNFDVPVRKNNTREKLIEVLLPFAQKTEKKTAATLARSVKKAGETKKAAKTVKALTNSAKKTDAQAAKPEKTAKKTAKVEKDVKKTVEPEIPVKRGRGRPARAAEVTPEPVKKPVETAKTVAPAKTVKAAKSENTQKTAKTAKTAKAEKAPVKVTAKPAKADKKPAKADTTPVKMAAKPAKTDKKTAKAETKSAKIEKTPAEITKKPPAEEPPAKPVKRGRGRPPKAVVNADATIAADESPLDAPACEASDAVVKGLSRSFAKRAKDAPPAKNKKGAEVMRDGVALPVEQSGRSNQKTSSKAEQIEKERSKRHSSLKTTMEVPIFQPSAVIEATSPISEDELTGDLPVEYGETRIVLQIRDPHWAYAYWEIPRVELKRLELEIGIFEFAHSHFVLRLHNVSQGFSQEIKLSEHARNWYIYLEEPQTVYQVELGMHSPAEGYSFIALSNLVQTPPDRVAGRWAAPVLPEPTVVDEERVGGHEIADAKPVEAPGIDRITAPEMVYFSSLSGAVIPHPGSSDLLAGQQLPPSEMPSSADVRLVPGGISSFEMPGSFAMPGSLLVQMPTSPTPSSADWSSATISSFGKRAEEPGADDIFLVADVEVIVYGRVKVGCELTFQGNPLRLRPDGSFSLRLALPFDSAHSIDLVATDPHTQKTRVIKAAVSLKKN